MPQAHAPEADYSSTVLSPTDDELAIMMELKAEQEQLIEMRTFYRCLIDFMYNDFHETYKESCDIRQDTDNLLAELMKTAVKLGFEIPEEHRWTQSTSPQSAESIEDFFLLMLNSPGSEKITSGDLPPGFPSCTPYTQSKPQMRPAVFDHPNFTADDFSLSACAVRTAANATVGGGLTSRTLSFVHASGANTSVGACSTSAACTLPNIIEQNVVRSAQNRKPKQCNPLSQRSPVCMPIPQCATQAANTMPVEPKISPELKTCTGTECMAEPKPESSKMNSTMEPLGPSAYELALMRRQAEVCQPPPQHLKPGGSCDNVPVASPRQVLAMHTQAMTDSQGERCFTGKEHLHPYPALETAGTLSESSPPAPTSSPIGGATTLVVRNIPAKYSKDMLLQEMPPDGTYDFFYLPFSFKQKKLASYLFLNFKSNAAALAFYSRWHGCSLRAQGPSSKLRIGVAEMQGLEQNVRQLVKRNIERIKNPKFLPSVFDGLREVPFSEYVEQMGRSPSAEL